jgi:hypothetical protein
MLAACARRNSAQFASCRLGAGSISASLKIVQTVLAGQLHTEPGELALDAPVAPSRVLAGESYDKSRISAIVAGLPGQRCGYVQRRATNSRCQRSIVAGVTNNDRFHTRRLRTRLNAGSARSAGLSAGRLTCRSSTHNWCRNSRISISFSRSERNRSTTSSSSRRSDQYTNERTTPRERPTAADPTHQPTTTPTR